MIYITLIAVIGGIILLGIILILLLARYIYVRFIKRERLRTGIDIVMGLPGAGKTTYAAYLAKRHIKAGYPVYSNVPINGAREFDVDRDALVYMVENALIIIDEAGLEHDARAWQNFKARYTKFYKLHRHYHLRIVLFSQHFEDIDKKIKTITENICVVTRAFVKYFIRVKKIRSYIEINEEGQIVLKYDWVPRILGGVKWHFAPAVWGTFDSWSHEELPEKEWKVYQVDKKQAKENAGKVKKHKLGSKKHKLPKSMKLS